VSRKAKAKAKVRKAKARSTKRPSAAELAAAAENAARLAAELPGLPPPTLELSTYPAQLRYEGPGGRLAIVTVQPDGADTMPPIVWRLVDGPMTGMAGAAAIASTLANLFGLEAGPAQHGDP